VGKKVTHNPISKLNSPPSSSDCIGPFFFGRQRNSAAPIPT